MRRIQATILVGEEAWICFSFESWRLSCSLNLVLGAGFVHHHLLVLGSFHITEMPQKQRKEFYSCFIWRSSRSECHHRSIENVDAGLKR